MPNVVRIQLRGAAGLVRAQTTRIPNGEGERDVAGLSRVSCNAELGTREGDLDLGRDVAAVAGPGSGAGWDDSDAQHCEEAGGRDGELVGARAMHA